MKNLTVSRNIVDAMRVDEAGLGMEREFSNQIPLFERDIKKQFLVKIQLAQISMPLTLELRRLLINGRFSTRVRMESRVRWPIGIRRLGIILPLLMEIL